jgi:hypothetical protein
MSFLSVTQRGISNIICGSRGLGTLERCDARAPLLRSLCTCR